MAKLIPENKPQGEAGAEKPEPAGPMLLKARELEVRLKKVEEDLDLDELDRLARRHARLAASGSAEALEALACVVRCAPELFSRTEVNLNPARLEGLADRGRCLDHLQPLALRFSELVSDSQLEQSDEVVELLTVGYRQAQKLDSARLYSNDRLAEALDVLARYHARVVEEKAHQPPPQEEPKKPRKKKA